MIRQPYLQKMLDLPVGKSVIIVPDNGDTVGALLGRLKRQAQRYKVHGKAWRIFKHGQGVELQRVQPGHQKKLGQYLHLGVGESFLYSASLDEAGKKALRARLVYIFDNYYHFLFAEELPDGRVFVKCGYRADTHEKLPGLTKGDVEPSVWRHVIIVPSGKPHDYVKVTTLQSYKDHKAEEARARLQQAS